jgi:hypothetical protein
LSFDSQCQLQQDPSPGDSQWHSSRHKGSSWGPPRSTPSASWYPSPRFTPPTGLDCTLYSPECFDTYISPSSLDASSASLQPYWDVDVVDSHQQLTPPLDNLGHLFEPAEGTAAPLFPPLPSLEGQDQTSLSLGHFLCAEEATIEPPPPAGEEEEEVFSASFFLNPFAANLPGDVEIAPQLMNPTMRVPRQAPQITISPSTPFVTTPASTSSSSAFTSNPAVYNTNLNTSNTTPSTSFAQPHHPPLPNVNFRQSSLATTTPSPPSNTSQPDSPTQDSGPTLHFIDHADKKSALRIRNTRISRAHRDNKVKRIQELEKKLAEAEKRAAAAERKLERSEAEKGTWRERALEMGWKE